LKLFKEGNVLQLKDSYPLRMAAVSDLHAGASRAGMPSIFTTKEKNTVRPNPVQKIINDHWKFYWKKMDEFKAQVVLVIGDVFAGTNRRERASELEVVKSLEDQFTMGLELLKPHVKNRTVLVWGGTGYHESQDTRLHRRLAEELEPYANQSVYMGGVSYLELLGRKRMRRILVAHEAPSAFVYTAMVMSREITFHNALTQEGKTLPVDMIIRAHLHRWIHVDEGYVHYILVPCWQGFVPYKTTIKYFGKLQPDIGGALILVDDKDRIRPWEFRLSKEMNRELHKQVIKITPIEKGKVIEKCLL